MCPRYNRFSLVLMVTHDCNLRCRYCYSGKKEKRVMSSAVGKAAIDRAIRSTGLNGTLELAFFGGEPMLETVLLQELTRYAKEQTGESGIGLKVSVTTNGTILTDAAKALFNDDTVNVAISCDGLPASHDRQRVDGSGHGTSSTVYKTLEYLNSMGKDYSVVSVVNPDNVQLMRDNIAFLKEMGVRCIELNLDLWSKWSDEDIANLGDALGRTARFWRDSLPELGINWFDEKLLLLSGTYQRETCRFGFGDIAVAPSGNLYPCERLIGDDDGTNSMRMASGVFPDDSFLGISDGERSGCSSCAGCNAGSFCSTDCRCSNYVRTGNVDIPDRLLCFKEKTCLQEVAKTLNQEVSHGKS